MTTRTWRAGLMLASTAWIQAAAPAQDAFLTQARAAYYSETREHMDRFKCRLAPDWNQLLSDPSITTDARARAVSLLESLQFALVLDRQGSPAITHQSPAAVSTQQADALKQIYGGMEQMMSGFFDTWKLFMVQPPLPDPGTPYHLKTTRPWRTLTYQEGEAQVEVSLGQDFDATEVKVVSPAFTSTILPSFTKTPRGLVLAGYRATYRSPKGEDATDLEVRIQNQEVGGCILPRIVDLRGTYNGSPFHVLVTFEDGQVTKF